MVQAVKDVVQHEPDFILEIVDNGFGSLAMEAQKVKALGANGEVSGSRVRTVWMVVDGGNVRVRLVSREVAKGKANQMTRCLEEFELGDEAFTLILRARQSFEKDQGWYPPLFFFGSLLQFFHRTKHHRLNIGPHEEDDKCEDRSQQHTGEIRWANQECTHKPLDKELKELERILQEEVKPNSREGGAKIGLIIKIGWFDNASFMEETRYEYL
nr:hypothetical protein [Tanacetum cinerariifolium]